MEKLSSIRNGFFRLLCGAQRELKRIAKKQKKPVARVLERDRLTGFWRVRK